MAKFPTIFFGHGSPMNAIEENFYTQTWQKIVKNIERPKAILVISAHYETLKTKITANKKLKTIHDFYGFPRQLFDVKYEPFGDLELAQKIQKLIPEIELDSNWGIDHGAWSVLIHTHPEADIPVLQLSIDKNKTPLAHYELAQKLQILRNEILIIGSGNIVHNLGLLDWHTNQPFNWAAQFEEQIKQALIANDHKTIIEFSKLAGSKLAVPTNEHFIPLLYILGLQDTNERAEIFCQGIELGSISMLGVKFG
ncbi:MAG: 4,5-DOPA dioxygenase extradiol [Pseudomonadota bacterium]